MNVVTKQTHTQSIKLASAAGFNESTASSARRNIAMSDAFVCLITFGLLCARKLAYQVSYSGAPGFADDAYYYFLVAKHIVAGLGSSFDGHYLTNGYHPLWLLLLVAQYKLAGTSLFITRGIEVCLGCVGLLAAFKVADLPNLPLKLVYTVGFFWIFAETAMNGMETTLFLPCYCVLLCVLSAKHSFSPVIHSLVAGLMAALAIGARIDSAVFVLPLLLFSVQPLLNKAVSMSVVGSLLGIYILINRSLFGLSMPVSGEVKSLGGLQVNRILFLFLLHVKEFTAFVFLATAVVFLAALVYAIRTRTAYTRETIEPQQLAFLIGFAVFSFRLMFLSSWVIWSWYNFPLMIAYLTYAPLLLKSSRLRRIDNVRPLTLATVSLLIMLIGFLRWHSFSHSARPNRSVKAAERLELARALDGIGNTSVAMGDLAGQFAFDYIGAVDQIEGIMNDKQYLNALEHKKDIRLLLCSRGVNELISYEPPLGDYSTHIVPTIRPQLSQFSAPVVTVRHGDENIRVRWFVDSDGLAGGRTYLYGWSLKCSSIARRLPSEDSH